MDMNMLDMAVLDMDMVDMDMVDMDMDMVDLDMSDIDKQGLRPRGSSVDTILSFLAALGLPWLLVTCHCFVIVLDSKPPSLPDQIETLQN